MQEELKPCPFCGGEMQFRKALWPSDGDTDAVIHAGPSECGMSDFSTYTDDESVIAAWNRRTPVSGEVVEFAQRLADDQKPLDAVATKILNDNAWDLYVGDEPVSAQGIDHAKLIGEALELAHDLAIEQQSEIAAKYEGYKPHKHAAAARDVELAKEALAAWQARGQQAGGAEDE